MLGPEGAPVSAEAIGVAPGVTERFDVQGHVSQVIVDETLVEGDTSIDSTDGTTVFKPPEGIGYNHEPGETFAKIKSKLGGDIEILVPVQGPFPDIPRDPQRKGHQAVRDRTLVKGDIETVLKPSEKILREMPEVYSDERIIRIGSF